MAIDQLEEEMKEASPPQASDSESEESPEPVDLVENLVREKR